jgi:YHS domain-containing protein
MKSKFVRCQFCKTEIASEECKLAAYRTVIEGKEYTFCCAQCTQGYAQKKKKKSK